MHECFKYRPRDFFSFAAGCQSGDVRLVHSNSTSGSFEHGHVEICYEGSFGSVCDSGWDEKDSHVLCTQLGYLEGAYVYEEVPNA